MTSNVRIEAHCSPHKEVLVVIDGESFVVQDGETSEWSVYDDREIVVKERVRPRYPDKAIADSTPQELLHALLHSQGISPGPSKTVYAEPVSETLVSIGDDASAHIRIFDEDIEALNKTVLGK